MSKILCTCPDRPDPDWNGHHEPCCPWLIDSVMARVEELEAEGRLDCLASNLAVAAGLCRAFLLGGHQRTISDWHPGCGKAAP